MPFAQIPHQSIVADQLIKTIRLQRLAHAYLLKGDRGVGKLQTAIALAQAVNCAKFSELHDACGQCDSCHRFESMNHPDLFHLKAESKSRQITIDQIQTLNKALFQKPMMAKYKVAVIEDADCMNAAAYNAFLKTLEEPPLNCLLLLLTSRPETLPDTIIARCQKLQFSFVSAKELSPLENETLDFLRGLSSEGNIFTLYQGLTGLIAELDTAVKDYKSRLNDSQDTDKWKDIAEKSYFQKVEQETEAQVSAFRRLERQAILKIFYLWHRDILMMKMEVDSAHLHFPGDKEILRSQAGKYPENKWIRAISLIEKLIDDLDRTNIPEMLAFETVCLKLQAK